MPERQLYLEPPAAFLEADYLEVRRTMYIHIFPPHLLTL